MLPSIHQNDRFSEGPQWRHRSDEYVSPQLYDSDDFFCTARVLDQQIRPGLKL